MKLLKCYRSSPTTSEEHQHHQWHFVSGGLITSPRVQGEAIGRKAADGKNVVGEGTKERESMLASARGATRSIWPAAIVVSSARYVTRAMEIVFLFSQAPPNDVG